MSFPYNPIELNQPLSHLAHTHTHTHTHTHSKGGKNKRRTFLRSRPFSVSFFPCECILFCDLESSGKKQNFFPIFQLLRLLHFSSICSREREKRFVFYPIGIGSPLAGTRKTIPIIEMPISSFFFSLFQLSYRGCKNLHKYKHISIFVFFSYREF